MNNNSNLPPVFNEVILKNQQSKNTFNTVKIILGFFLLLMAVGGIASNEIVSGMLFLIAGLILFPLTLKIIEDNLVKLKSVFKYLIVIGFTITGFAVLIGNEPPKTQTPITEKQPSVAAQTTDSLSDTSVLTKTVVAPMETAEERKEKIEKQFSGWDGSHRNLVAYVKDKMNDPDSFEHIETRYSDKGDYLIVTMKYRGKNAFGAKVINYCQAKIDLDGNVLSITD